jgi:hypothetical protein
MSQLAFAVNEFKNGVIVIEEEVLNEAGAVDLLVLQHEDQLQDLGIGFQLTPDQSQLLLPF